VSDENEPVQQPELDAPADPDSGSQSDPGVESEPLKEAAVDPQNLNVVLDIPVRVSMEVGSTSISIKKLLKLNRGSVIELSRLAGEPLDVLVNGTPVAQGEVVVVNEKFGIRLTDIMSPEKRIHMLR